MSPDPTYAVKMTGPQWRSLGFRLAELCRQDPDDARGRELHDALREQLAPQGLTAWTLP